MSLRCSLAELLTPLLTSATSATGDASEIQSWLHRYSPLRFFTQSLWRDEAYSVLMAERPLSESLPKLTLVPEASA